MRATAPVLSALLFTACSHASGDAASSAVTSPSSTPAAARPTSTVTSHATPGATSTDARPLASSGDARTPSSARPTGPQRVAHTSASCAPWDGAAVDLVVDDVKECATSPRAMVAIAIWKGLPLASGKVLDFRDGSQEGSGRKCPADGSRCTMAKHVELVIDTYDDKTMAMTGYYTLTFADGSTLSESFNATRCGDQARCG